MIFEEYVEQIVKADEEDTDKAPVCIFPSNCGECYVQKRDPQFGCMNCSWAEEAYLGKHPEMTDYLHRVHDLIEEMIVTHDNSGKYLTYFNYIRKSFGLRELQFNELRY